MSNYIPKKSIFDPNSNGEFGVGGEFGIFGGQYVPETLMPILKELEATYSKYRFDKEFWAEVNYYLKDYVGRENPLYFAKNISDELGAKIYLKREDLNHTGAHKVNNVIAQGLLAKKMGKTKVIAETGAGQHGVATATIAALLGLECTVFMGAKDVQRQELNVFRMKLLGAKVVAVESGSKTLKDAMNDAIRYWVTNARDTFYIIGTVAGPHPYPMMVRDFQAIIGYESRKQILEKEEIIDKNSPEEVAIRKAKVLADHKAIIKQRHEKDLEELRARPKKEVEEKVEIPLQYRITNLSS